MFKAPFSFDGRIRRTEYGLSFLIFIFETQLVNSVISGTPELLVLHLPGLWFMWAQGSKRCHDIGISGWWQLIPFSWFGLTFSDGKPGMNAYGPDPKGRRSAQNELQTTPQVPPRNIELEAAEEELRQQADAELVEIAPAEMAHADRLVQQAPAVHEAPPAQPVVVPNKTGRKPTARTTWMPLLIALVIVIVFLILESLRNGSR